MLHYPRSVGSIAIILGLSLPHIESADPKPVALDLGGPRKVQAFITATDSHYSIELSMRPVQAFDEATNDEVNQELAREYALRALAKHMSGDQDVQFTSGGAQVIESGAKNDRFRLVIRWDKDRVQVIGPQKKTPPEPNVRVLKTKAFSGKLFTARQDHVDTLAALAETNKRTIEKALTNAVAAKSEDRRKILLQGIAAAEERGLDSLEKVRKAVEADEDLFDITERPELLEAVRKQREQLLTMLRNAVNAPEEPSPPKKTPPAFDMFSSIKINAPFDEYLAANPLLMEVAGAMIIDLGPDRKVLIGVAKTILKDTSDDELLRAEKVCPIKARTAIIGERDGAHISYLKRVKDQIEIVTDEKGEKSRSVTEFTRLTEERIQGLTKNMPVVGRWQSKNGKVFYLAVGTIVDGKGQPVKP